MSLLCIWQGPTCDVDAGAGAFDGLGNADATGVREGSCQGHAGWLSGFTGHCSMHHSHSRFRRGADHAVFIVALPLL